VAQLICATAQIGRYGVLSSCLQDTVLRSIGLTTDILVSFILSPKLTGKNILQVSVITSLSNNC